jgi:hypothetical protein
MDIGFDGGIEGCALVGGQENDALKNFQLLQDSWFEHVRNDGAAYEHTWYETSLHETVGNAGHSSFQEHISFLDEDDSFP